MSTELIKSYGGLKQVLVVSIGLFLVYLDTTIVNIALPEISAALEMNLSTASWVINAFVISVAVLLIALGKIADIFGSYRVYMIGLVIFMVASFLCGIAPDTTSLIVFRVLQGIGAATVIPASLLLVHSAVPPEKIGVAMGIWGGIGALGIAFGPSLGGIVTEFISWRWVFFINIPIVLISLVFTIRVFRHHHDVRKPFHLDFAGLATFGIGMYFLTYAILQGHDNGWTSSLIIASFAISLIMLLLFTYLQHKVRYPLLDMKIFKSRLLIAGIVANLQSGILLMGMLIILPFYFTDIREMDTLTASLYITPTSLVMIVVAPIIGRMIDRIGYVVPLIIGYLISITGFYLLSMIQTDSSHAYLVAAMMTAGVGIGVLVVTSMTIGTATVANEHVALGSSLFATLRNIGGAIGVALFVSIVVGNTSNYGPELATKGITLPDYITDAMSMAYFSGVVVSVVSLLSLWLLRKSRQQRFGQTDKQLAQKH